MQTELFVDATDIAREYLKRAFADITDFLAFGTREVQEYSEDGEPLYMRREQRMALIQVSSNFSDRERQCYVMHTAEGLSMQKIADKLGLSKWTVRTYINRAKEKVEEITAA